MPPPDKPKAAATGQAGNWSELDQAARGERLAARLRANLARRKRQARSRDVDGPRDAAGPGGPLAPRSKP